MARHLIKSDVILRTTKPTDKTLRVNDGDELYLLIRPSTWGAAVTDLLVDICKLNSS